MQKIVGVALGEVTKTAVVHRAAEIAAIQARIQAKHPENPVSHGFSVYSQNEEDGIIQHINKIIGVTHPSFLEFGVHLTENNTMNLLLSGGRGAWIDKGLADFKARCPSNSKLLIIDEFITRENIHSICLSALNFLRLNEATELDFLSLDLDGNDYYFVQEIVSRGFTPKVLCLEYNAKFPPPQKAKIIYNSNHTWTNNDDYFGCSLQEYVDLLTPLGYRLIACNITGSNCFFVRHEYSGVFKVLTTAELYQPPRPYLSPFPKGAQSSGRYLLALLAGDSK